MLRYGKIEVFSDNGIYTEARYEYEQNGIRQQAVIYGKDEIWNFIEYVAYYQGMKPKSLYDNGQVVIFQKNNTYGNIQNIPGTRLNKPLNKKLTNKVVSIAAAGVLAITGIGVGVNHHMNKTNPYDGYIVKTYTNSKDAKVDKNLKSVLRNYDEFEEMFTKIANNDSIEMSEQEFNQFIEQLDSVINCNNVGIAYKYEYANDNLPQTYRLYLENYYSNSSPDYVALKEFNATKITYNYNRTINDKSELKNYIFECSKFLLDDGWYYMADNANGGTTYYNSTNINPMTRYIIATQLKPLIEAYNNEYETFIYMNKVSSRKFTKEELLEKINGIIDNAMEDMQNDFIKGQNKGRK